MTIRNLRNTKKKKSTKNNITQNKTSKTKEWPTGTTPLTCLIQVASQEYADLLHIPNTST